MYTKEEFISDCRDLFGKTEGDLVTVPGVGEIMIYDEPIIGFASASDEIFESYRRPEVVGAEYMLPKEWLSSAKTVISFFFPFSEAVRASNRKDRTEPSMEWLYGRVEGQVFMNAYMAAVKKLFEDKGIDSCIPSSDKRFGTKYEETQSGGRKDFHAVSKWSERHAAYACGLGTFGLSRGLISEKGLAGRYASIIIPLEWEAVKRRYSGVYDYCIRCGACVRNCPVQAISLEYGKNNVICNAQLEKTRQTYSHGYGCGKCQVGVPCEHEAPGLKA